MRLPTQKCEVVDFSTLRPVITFRDALRTQCLRAMLRRHMLDGRPTHVAQGISLLRRQRWQRHGRDVVTAIIEVCEPNQMSGKRSDAGAGLNQQRSVYRCMC